MNCLWEEGDIEQLTRAYSKALTEYLEWKSAPKRKLTDWGKQANARLYTENLNEALIDLATHALQLSKDKGELL